MRIAYLDCFSGISGDMFLGALVDGGVSLALLEQAVAALNIGARLEANRVMRSGIAATKLDVIIDGEKDLPREVFQAQRAAHFHEEHTDAATRHHHPGAPLSLGAPFSPEAQRRVRVGDESESTGAAPSSGAPPSPGAQRRVRVGEHSHHHGRSLKQVRELIAAAPISPNAKRTSTAIFDALGAAEAKIHQVPVDEIHFHEVGSADAIVDIVCAAVGSEALGVDEWVCSPVNVGGGAVECAHGRFPVPAPATLELLSTRNTPVYSSGIDKELTTPTGAAILSVLVSRFAPFPPMKIDRIAYGAGYRDLDRHANVLRLTIGEAEQSSVSPASPVVEAVSVLEANLDDLSPQVIGYLFDRALAAGALDVFTTPVQMKKSRPGLLLTILCQPADAGQLARLLFTETTTLGVRMRQETRQCLPRRHVTVNTSWGDIRIKLAILNGVVTNFAPEYEDCRRIAEAYQIPLKTVMQEAVRLYLERHHE
ncbi:MAG: nickel pincer cofactor biosynthesis protein LarC [Terriglobales bacterium]